MAARKPGAREIHGLGDFERAFEELFDELLLGRWRPSWERADERAVIVDRGGEYEVTIAAALADRDQIEVEASDWRLVVRIPGAAGARERAFDFPQAIDGARARARWDDGALRITLPKRRGLRIKVE